MRTVLTLTGLALLAGLATPVAAAPILRGPSFDIAKDVVAACNKHKKDEPDEPSGELVALCSKHKQKDEPAEPSGECGCKKDEPKGDEPSGEAMALCSKNKQKDEPAEPSGEAMALCSKHKQKDEPVEPSGECGCKKDEPKGDEPSDG